MNLIHRSCFASRSCWILAARIALGGCFIYLGAMKALEPALFLKNLRLFHWTENPWLLNSTAAILPWFEIVCGVFLVLGVAARGASLLTLLLLAGFTFMIVRRAHEIGGSLPICAIRFDCGCGQGEMNVCRKLAENIGLMALAVCVLVSPGGNRSE